MFKYELGLKAKDLVTGLVGVITSRSEHLNGCRKYTLQPAVSKKQDAMPDAYWVDESAVKVLNDKPVITHQEVRTGGPTTRMQHKKAPKF